jgi:hypothetical protein
MRSGVAGFHDSVGRYFSPPYVRGNEAIPNSAASKTAILVIFIFIIHGFRDGGAAVDIRLNSSSLGRAEASGPRARGIPPNIEDHP